MNDHNLDDLIIGNPESSGSKSKSILTLIALLAIIVIVGTILYQLVIGGGEKIKEGSGATELTSVVNPAMQQGKTARKKPATEEAIPEELKPIVEEKLPTPATAKPLATKTPKTKIVPKAKAKINTTTTTNKPKPKTKSSQKKPSELFKKRETVKTGTEEKKIYYIQVGSFKRPPTQKFLDGMKAKGYKPVIVKTGEMIKVRVGPYSSYDVAKNKLPEIKEKLGINGFVVRKK